MSYTELVFFNKKGIPAALSEFKNSHRGASAIWDTMDKKYLLPFIPPHNPYLQTQEISRTLAGLLYKTSTYDPMKELWDLLYEEKVTRTDRIVFGSTFDNVIVLKENFEELITAFKIFEGNTSLLEQAKSIENSVKSNKFIAIAWNQTSIGDNKWFEYYNKQTGRCRKYNILKDDNHWNLFEEINKIEKNFK